MKRRFSITQAEGEIISLALHALELVVDMEKELRDSPYWKMQVERGLNLKSRIENYSWTK